MSILFVVRYLKLTTKASRIKRGFFVLSRSFLEGEALSEPYASRRRRRPVPQAVPTWHNTTLPSQVCQSIKTSPRCASEPVANIQCLRLSRTQFASDMPSNAGSQNLFQFSFELVLTCRFLRPNYPPRKIILALSAYWPSCFALQSVIRLSVGTLFRQRIWAQRIEFNGVSDTEICRF